MSKNSHKVGTCQICGREISLRELVPAPLVSEVLTTLIRQSHPAWTGDGYVCRDDLRQFRARYLQGVVEEDRGELSALEREVIESLREQDVLAANSNVEFDQRLTLGQHAADRLADLAGSWTFILIFAGVLIVWIAVNSIVLLWRPFDPYPFILLNLVLSCLAAVQAPVIMMSQNRQEARDRLRAENDYRTNLKAELEIRHLHAKLDELMTNQWHRLLEIQQMQVEMMEEFNRGRTPQPPRPS